MSQENIVLHALENADGPLDLASLQDIVGGKALPIVRALEVLERKGRITSRVEGDVTVWMPEAIIAFGKEERKTIRA